MAEIIMTIKAPRGELNLYKLNEYNRYLISRLREQQAEAIKAFMEQHNANA